MQAYIRYTKFILVFVFIVIAAGGIVRTTQSGMGCPDWPRCFGMWIPPTEASQLPADFEKYLSKQDIDHTFNVYHTWIEYINRLLGALLGLFIIIHVAWSYRKFFTSHRGIFWWSFGLLLLTGFQGWLGKRVVDANLAVVKITTHMLVALLIAAIPIIILRLLSSHKPVIQKQLVVLANIALVLITLQIVVGTEVREQIDVISKNLNYEQRTLWIQGLDSWFKVHQLMSWVVAGSSVYLFWKALSFQQLHSVAYWLLFAIVGTMLMGLLMAYVQMPAFAQPSHLVLSSILCMALVAYRLHVSRSVV